MKKRFRRIAASVLAAAMLFQQCAVTGLAKEAAQEQAVTQEQQAEPETKEAKAQKAAEPETKAPQTEPETKAPQTEPETKAPQTEPETKAPQTEPETEAPQTEPETKAPQTEPETQAPQTEPETKAPQTEPETEAPQTEPETKAPQTEAPQTEPETQAPQTEPETQAPQTEPETQELQPETETQEPETEAQTEDPMQEQETESGSEAETAESESEQETERADRKNDGKKIEDSTLLASLNAALPYLFAGESVALPQALEETTEEQLIADGAAGSGIVSGLRDFSVTLANGKTSKMIAVLNVYADENGKLDTRQLEAAFSDKVIDVTDQYYVVNVIAAKKNQTLQFSGYSMKNGGKTVAYKKAAQRGDILYNFAFLDKETYKPFEGTVKLSSDSGLQGTFLAPDADVKVESDLAGAVYAKSVAVSENVSELLRIVYIRGAEVEKAAASAVRQTEVPNQEETSGTEEAQTAGTEEIQTAGMEEMQTDDAEEVQTDGTEEVQIAGTEEVQTDDAEEPKETGVLPQKPAAKKNGTEAADVPEQIEDGAKADPEELTVEEEPEADPDSEEEGRTWYSEEGKLLQIRLSDAEDPSAKIEAEAVIRAAEEILNTDGSVKYEKGAEVEQVSWTESTSVSLHYSGSYYLEMTKAPAVSGSADGYLMPGRIYFRISEQGELIASEISGRYTWQDGLLTIAMQKQAQAEIWLVDADGAAVAAPANTAFVVKDAEGTVLRGTDGQPEYYLEFKQAESHIDVYGLAEGSYILSELKAPEGYRTAADQEFTVAAGTIEKIQVKHMAAGKKSLDVALQSSFQKTVLTAEKKGTLHAALFSDADLTKRVSEVKSLTYSKSADKTEPTSFEGLDDGTYYIGMTDEYGEVEKEKTRPYKLQIAGQSSTEIVFDAADQNSRKSITVNMEYTTYPKKFSYLADVQITMEVKNLDGSARKSDDTFYAMLYKDEAYKKKALSEPIVLAMDQKASVTASVQVKMKAASGTFYLAETDEKGKLLKTDDTQFEYGITYPNGRIVTVSCGAPASGSIQNKINDSVVRFRVESEKAKKQLAGARLVVKNKKTGERTDIFVSKDQETVWKNKLAAGVYVLTELTAPSGYANTADVEFTVEEGRTTEVVMTNAPVVKTSGSLTAVMEIYSGSAPVYARDISAGTYAEEGRYTFYAALFSDKERTKKVSDVQKITVSGLSGTTVFENLTKGETYYLSETDAYGTVLKSEDPRGETCKIQYTNAGKVTASSGNHQAVIRNTYSSLPRGYRNTATLTVTKRLQNASGEAESATKTFYAGIFRTSDYSDQPTVIPLSLENSSEASARRRILLPGTNDITYYIAEVDENGRRITDEGAFGYTVSVDQPSVTLSGGDDKNVTITNRTKISKVTLYLTKKVYQGVSQKAVNETFYAGLFKDPEFTQLYANPIPLQLNGKSEVTLKLTLNLGAASGAKIYVAEVDQDGKVVQAGEDFGYDIRVVNAAAEFTQERTEIQSILLNSVYSAASSDNWNQILGSDGNNVGIGGGGGDWFSSNGGGNASENGSVKTGDETPILPYAVGLLAAAAVIAAVLLTGKKKRK